MTIYALMYSFPNLEPVWYFMSSSNCCFLTCISDLQEVGKVVWCSHLLKNFPQVVVMHIVKGFSVVNEANVDVFLDFLAFSMIQWMLAVWSLVPLSFLNPACPSGSSGFMYCWSLALRILSTTLPLCVKWVQLCGSLNILWHWDWASLGLGFPGG